MYDAGMDRHYFIDELAALKDGQMVIPVHWLENESGEVYFDVWEVKVNEQTASPMSSKNGNRITPNLQIFSKGLSTILDQEVVIVASSDLKCNLLDLEDLNLISEWCSQTIASGCLVMMCLETAQRVGTNTGIFISRTETCPGSFSINNATSISSQPQQMQPYLSSLML